MSIQNILHINSSGRYKGSVTRQVSDLIERYLKTNTPSLISHQRDVATGLPFINEAWIQANFTDPDKRSDIQKQTLNLSDKLVTELQQAEHIIIASPLYNFGIPATLKAWIDLISRVHLTFRYNDQGQPEGLLQNKKVTVVMASGGTPLASDWDIATPYLKQILGFLGISDITFIDANQIDVDNEDSFNQIAALMT